jgi:hypothetical protein
MTRRNLVVLTIVCAVALLALPVAATVSGYGNDGGGAVSATKVSASYVESGVVALATATVGTEQDGGYINGGALALLLWFAAGAFALVAKTTKRTAHDSGWTSINTGGQSCLAAGGRLCVSRVSGRPSRPAATTTVSPGSWSASSPLAGAAHDQ